MYQKSTLENGIRVVTESMPGHRSISLGLLVDAGPREETQGQSGLAHLVEHVLFCGTSSRNASQIARFMDEAGGHMGAFTARDYTCYSASVLDEYFTYALDLLGDILLNSIFPPANLEREKSAILREIESACDVPSQQAHDLLKAFAWPDHYLGQPVAGRAETIHSLTREDVIYFMYEHYLPDRLIVAAAGNVDHLDFVAQVRDAFWRMIGSSLPAADAQPVHRAGVTLVHMPVSLVYFSLGIPASPYAHPDRYRIHVLNNILGGGVSSRLHRRLRENRGLVYHIGSEYHAYRNAGMLIIEGSAAPENIQSVIGTVIEEIHQLASEEKPVTEEELWKAKMHIRGQHLISGENTHTRMSRLAAQELYFGRRVPDDEILSEIEAIRVGKLQALAFEALGNVQRRSTIAIVGPEAPNLYQKSTIEGLLGDPHECPMRREVI
jgi:predicted Zn-dependent peptidase